MNCKPGDLAVIVRATSQSQHIGKVVKVVERYYCDAERCGWVTEPELFARNGRCIVWLDRGLRPLRDSDGPDETIAWAGKPKEDLLQIADRLIREFNQIAEQAKELK